MTDTSEIEPPARAAGAVVHFDVKRVSGVDRAVNVRLRAGTRVSPHQGRFGDLVGARRPETAGNAPSARRRTGPSPSPEDFQPSVVARRWVDLAQADDPAVWTDVYAPDVELHLGNARVAGRDAVMRTVHQALRAAVVRGPRDVTVNDSEVEITWAAGTRTGVIHTRLRIAHGEIAEQWLG